MIVINGIEMDDGVDEPNERDEDYDDESPLGPEGCFHGKCESCGAEWSELPENDEGVCAVCGCHSVREIPRAQPPIPNA